MPVRERRGAAGFRHDGGTLATGSADNATRMWDARSGKLLATLKGHTDNVSAVGFTPDVERVVTGSHDRTVRVWDAGTAEPRRTLEGHSEADQNARTAEPIGVARPEAVVSL